MSVSAFRLLAAAAAAGLGLLVEQEQRHGRSKKSRDILEGPALA